MIQTRQRSPLPFPLLLLWSLTVALLSAGCASTPLDNINAAVEAFNQGNPGQANGFLSAAVSAASPAFAALGGGESDAYAEVARSLLKADRGRPADAVNFLRNALKKPDLAWSPLLWAALADASALAGDSVEAATARREAARRAEAIMDTIGRAARGDREQTRRFLQAGAYYHETQKDTPRALQAWREALRREPTNSNALNSLGYTLADEGTSPQEFEEAKELTRQAVRFAPDIPALKAMTVDSYGWALFKTGDVKGARRVLREAVDAAPEQPELRYHLGMVYARLEMIKEADNEWTRALRLRPEYAEAQKALALLRRPSARLDSRSQPAL